MAQTVNFAAAASRLLLSVWPAICGDVHPVIVVDLFVAVAQALKAAAAESEANRFAAAEQQLQQAQAQVEAAEGLGGSRQVRAGQSGELLVVLVSCSASLAVQ